MALKCILTVSCISLLGSAQVQDGYNLQDRIYFDDGGQRFPVNVLPLDNKRVNLGNRGVSYLHGNPQSINAGLASSSVPQNNNFGNNAVPLSNNFGNPVTQDFNRNNNLNGGQIPSVTVQPPYPDTSIRFGETADTYAGQGLSNASTAYVDPVSLALSDFGINLMNNIRGQQGNLVISPFSIATLLALLQQGSLGATQQQITAALQLTPSQAADGFRKLTKDIQKRTSSNIFNVANGIFIADGFDLNPAYKRIAKNDFGSEVNPIKFNRPAVAAQKINNWVASKTNNKIDRLLTPDTVGDNTQLVLVNAVYFKGLWAVKFKPESTVPKEFHLGNGSAKTASFMRMRRFFKTDFDQSTNSQVLILPFEGNHYSLVLILPTETTPVALALASLTKEKLLSYQNLPPREVALEIPKFTVKSDTDLVSVMRGLGMVNMFGPKSELSGIGAYREFSPQISSALHSALLSIDEQGGVAAAATSFGVVALSNDDASVVFKANRPFLAVLWDNTASIPLFMAKIEDPVS